MHLSLTGYSDAATKMLVTLAAGMRLAGYTMSVQETPCGALLKRWASQRMILSCGIPNCATWSSSLYVVSP
eukprot:7181973-Ditylum_brightwellii.AAC.1